ncbi:hypothetical protein AVEN_98218-1 [Araneus ventricosus]|uniref:Uncharacterized protein n=1 Tax=Araneus ventricosus TaxID=182803 RepID=A0A4Y2LBX6_ARAVE|nr:hypothetical protein AVEN_98218-1 [Araneus ventricosus]
MAKKAVGIAKALFKKAHEDNKGPTVALLEYRNTPISGIGLSPAQLMFNRRMRTKLPVSGKLLDAEIFKDVIPKLKERQTKKKFYFGRTTKALI